MYDELLKDTPLIRPQVNEHVSFNYAYYPVIFESEGQLKRVREVLVENVSSPRMARSEACRIESFNAL